MWCGVRAIVSFTSPLSLLVSLFHIVDSHSSIVHQGTIYCVEIIAND